MSFVTDATSRSSSAFFSKITVPVEVSAKMTEGDVTSTGVPLSKGAARVIAGVNSAARINVQATIIFNGFIRFAFPLFPA